MKSELITKEKNLVSVRMEFSAEEFDKAVNSVYIKTRGGYAVDGFRRGKAPRGLIERKFGEGVFFEDAINDLLRVEYPKMLDELSITPVDRPDLDFDEIEKGKPFAITAKITVEPEVQVKDYKGIEVKKVSYSVTEKEIQEELEILQKRNGRMVVAERAAKDGDTVLIDYAGFTGEEQFEGGTAEKQPLKLGSGSFIPGFEDQLIGAKAGDEVDVKVTFPEEYHSEDLAGKEAVFKVKVHEVKETELPELNDEFAKDVSEFDTLDEYKADIKAKLEESAQARAGYEQRNAMLETIYNATEIDIPPVMIEDQVQSMLAELEQQIRYQGMDMTAYLKYTGKTMSALQEGLKPDAEKKVKSRLILEAIAKAEKIEPSQEEIETELTEMAAMYRMELEKLKENFGPENQKYLEQDIRLKKTVDFLIENANIVEASE